MNKALIKIGIALGALFVLYHLVAWFGLFRMFSISTSSSEPNIKMGSRVLVSNLVSSEVGDMIVFSNTDSLPKVNYFVFRLSGQSGDTIQIKKGVMFVNGKNIDKNFECHYRYAVFPPVLTERLEELKNDERISSFFTVYDTIGYAYTDSITALKYGMERLMDSVGHIDTDIQNIYGKPWNKDYFGPLVIPKGKLFILGDNRDNAFDSRFLGLIDQTNYVGKVIYP